MKTLADTSSSANQMLQLIEPELRDVEKRLKTEALSGLPLVSEMNRYLHDSGGKRLRPGLLLLVTKLFGVKGETPLQLGVIVELIHVATLVHDDIIDNATMRRGRASLNAKWGNQVTVLFGDWLYMTAFAIALKEENFRILDILIDATRTMVEGELLQLQQNHRLDTTAERHLEINWHKTAHLFAGCSRLGAVLGGAEPDVEGRLAEYGKSIGMAFQLIDDTLDYSAAEEVLGKPVLKDLEEGNVTLPVINLLKRATDEECAFVRSVVDQRDFSQANKSRILDLVREYETLDESRELARHYAEKARQALNGFESSTYRDVLLGLPEFLISRRS